MDIQEFVKNTLAQIETGANQASNKSKKYYLDVNSSKGVHFNLAVTNTLKEDKKSGGKIGIGIQIVSADIGKSGVKTVSSENVSRIEFNIKYRDLESEKKEEKHIENMKKDNKTYDTDGILD